MKRWLWLILFFMGVSLSGGEWPTPVERSQYARTSLYAEVVEYLYDMQKISPTLRLLSLATSTEGRTIPLVVLSQEGISQPRELAMGGRPAVLIMANIHAGEVEGKEACLTLIRDIVTGPCAGLLDRQVILIVPIFNPDGNDKLGHNRRDVGPELAGVRYNGQNLDLNRDFVKLESPELRGLAKLLREWDPVLVVDMHTTNGSLHREPVTYTTLVNPNTDAGLRDYMWQKFFPAVARTLKESYGTDSVPYGNFSDSEHPEQGWVNDSLEVRQGSNYVGMRNRFTILDENYSYADFPTRVRTAQGFIKSILEYTSRNIADMAARVRQADLETLREYSRQPFALSFTVEKLFDVTVKSYEFSKEKIAPEDRAKYPPWIGEFIMKKTDVLRDYRVPYLCRAVPVKTVSLPAGYLILPFHGEALDNLRAHGLRIERLAAPFRTEAENFKIASVILEKNIFQGHVLNRLQGGYEKGEFDFPAGSYFVGLDQPLARLVPVLLEPESEDSLAAWGFFNRVLVHQWTNQPGVYPVYRILKRPQAPLLSE